MFYTLFKGVSPKNVRLADGEDLSIVLGSSEIGMPALRLRYHDHSLDKESQLAWRMRTAGTKADDSDDCLVADRNVETVLVTGDEEASPNPLEKLLARGCS